MRSGISRRGPAGQCGEALDVLGRWAADPGKLGEALHRGPWGLAFLLLFTRSQG